MIAINVEPVNFNVSQTLISNVEDMFSGIDKYNDLAVNADIYLKSLRETPKKDKEVSIRVNMPGKDIFVAKQGADFTSAAQDVYDTLKVSLRKHKEIKKDRQADRFQRP